MAETKILVLGLMGALCCGFSVPVHAQTPTEAPSTSEAASNTQPGISIYSYEDDTGVIHFVDSLDLVPEAYRIQAAERAKAGAMIGDGQGTVNVIPVPSLPETGLEPSLDAGSGNAAGAGSSGANGAGTTSSKTSPAGGGTGQGDAQGATQPAPKLEGKAYWQDRIAQWQQRKAAAETELQQVEAQIHRARTLTPPGFQQTLVELQQKHKELEEEIRLAEDMLANVIPEEARKAGVPPGWLR